MTRQPMLQRLHIMFGNTEIPSATSNAIGEYLIGRLVCRDRAGRGAAAELGLVPAARLRQPQVGHLRLPRPQVGAVRGGCRHLSM